MPILLITPFIYGTNTYPQVNITNIRIRAEQQLIILDCQYGNTMASQWVSGLIPPQKVMICDRPALMGMGADAEGNAQVYEVEPACTHFSDLSGDYSMNNLLQFLIDEGHYAGTIV